MSDALESQAVNVFYAAVGWLRSTYPEHQIVVERDLVWTIQRRIAREIGLHGLPLRVFNDYGVEPGPRRSLSADLALLSDRPGPPLFVAEFKFEPSHRQLDIDPRKLPVVGWEGVVEDAARIRRWVAGGLVRAGAAFFVDEGGFAQSRRAALPDCTWNAWGTYETSALNVWVHQFTPGVAGG